MPTVERGPSKTVGRYALYGEIAAGGMATVHLGRLHGPVGFARAVAIKRLLPQFVKDPEFVSMFLDEARLAARVQHPNVVATIDVVATEGELFLIMDYVRGESLARLVRAANKAGKRVPPRICASIVCGLLHGLHAAHEAKNERGEPLGLVHRDVSPQNVLVGADGVARVLDFGVAKAAGRVQVTRDGQIKGKLAYMPQEQLQGGDITRAVDVYASAVVLWETLTGERLFKGETEAETLANILRCAITPASLVVDGLNPAFDDVVQRGLEREPKKRFATTREMALALEHCEGIASATEVGEWVEQIAGNTLIERERRIAAMESDGIQPSEDSGSDVSAAVHPSGRPRPSLEPTQLKPEATDTEVAPSSARIPVHVEREKTEVMASRPRMSEDDVPSRVTGSKLSAILMLPMERRTPMIAAGVSLLLLVAVVLLVLLARKDPNATNPAGIDSVALSATPPGGSIPDPISMPSASATPDTSAAPMDSVSENAPPVVKPPVKPPPQNWNTPVRPPPPPQGVKKNCDPPYTIDAKGHHHYRPECM